MCKGCLLMGEIHSLASVILILGVDGKYGALQYRFLLRQQRPVYLILGTTEEFLILVLANKTQTVSFMTAHWLQTNLA